VLDGKGDWLGPYSERGEGRVAIGELSNRSALSESTVLYLALWWIAGVLSMLTGLESSIDTDGLVAPRTTAPR